MNLHIAGMQLLYQYNGCDTQNYANAAKAFA